MKVTLVTASFNDLVHGTFNDKKTGCGINLMKPETATRYTKGREMSYLGELTCEKCKAKIAKEMIKADSKEMKALLKEEKLRAKRGEDDGLVQLSELASKPASVTPPEPEPPVSPVESVQTNNNPVDDLIIKKPEPPIQETPVTTPIGEEDDFLAQFAIKKPQETPAPVEEEEDFLAQFAIKKPQETPAPVEEDDFLAQFSVSAPQKETTYEEPSAPPVIDDIADALSAMNNNPVMRKEPVPEPEQDDILSMFAIDKSEAMEENTSDYINPLMDDYEDESIFDAMNTDDDTSNMNEWDIIANQLFGDVSDEEPSTPPVIEDITVPEIEDIPTPVLDDIAVPEIEDIPAPVFDDIAIPEIEDIPASALDDIAVPEIEDIPAPVDIAIPKIEDIPAPVLDDIAVPEIEDIPAPVDIVIPEIEDIPTPVLDDIAVPEIEDIPAPALDDIAVPEIEVPDLDETPVAEEIPEPVKPVAPAPKPVAPAPVQQAPKPVAPIPPVPPVQPVIPPVQPMPQNVAPQPMGVPMGMGMGQIVTVPQQTGFDQNGQPMYAYMQMIFQGYDQNGQPIMMPMPQNMMGMGMPMGMPMQMPIPPVQQPQQPQQSEYSSLNKNSRLQSILNSLDEPVSEKEMTIGQKIAAAEAAKGSPVSANVSKIATNPHSRSTSQAFINAISDAKDDTQSLTESQGLKPKTVVLDSIEDVLSQLGDNSLKEKKEREAKLQNNVPVYQEFKTPTRTASSSFSRPVPSSNSSGSAMSDIPLTKAQQKELKKQQKIDAKFQKEMAKRKK